MSKMPVNIDKNTNDNSDAPVNRSLFFKLRALMRRFRVRLKAIGFSSLTHRIVILNLGGLVVLASGILYLNQFQEGLIDARVQSLTVQGEIIAGALAASATADMDGVEVDPEQLLNLQTGESLSPYETVLSALNFPVDPEQAAPLLRRLISPTKTRARIYDRDGLLLLDSRNLYTRGQIIKFDLNDPTTQQSSWVERLSAFSQRFFKRTDLPLYKELDGDNGRGYPEVNSALGGGAASIVRLTKQNEMIVSVAVPIQRFRGIVGVLLLSTQGGDIDAIVRAERYAILRVFLVAALVMIVLSLLLASTIAGPMRNLSHAALRVQKSVSARASLPDFSDRHDEIGHLARSLKNMTDSLYSRMDAIERFAADVAHELKNPLTSLRSALETLTRVKDEQQKKRLTAIIYHDLQRLDRLISDISDASRLDAELAREEAKPLNLEIILRTVVEIARDLSAPDHITIAYHNIGFKDPHNPPIILGDEGRIGQVLTNLLENARSFSKSGDTISVSLLHEHRHAILYIDDQGLGIKEGMEKRIFERFYTDREGSDPFGNNSGLGLSISKQIIELYEGTIKAQNRYQKDTHEILGARFIVKLPLKL